MQVAFYLGRFALQKRDQRCPIDRRYNKKNAVWSVLALAAGLKIAKWTSC
jgi:hypothetical protein